ncbi:hypothetical protein Gohar_013158, partial [Gossypium harknessii]|nr:hypothetical protein [Gossypium harknessii]
IWKPPEGFKVKANLDVSFNHLTYKAVAGVLIRNGDGLIMAAGIYPFESVTDSIVAEAKACLSAMILLNDLGFRAVCFDSVEFRYVPRQSNQAKHTLAAEGRRFEGIRVWVEEALVGVEAVVDRERQRVTSSF